VTDPAVVTLHLWRVPRRAVPRALLHMATDRAPLRAAPGLRFAKLLGTGSGRTFTARDADPRRWGLLTVWDDESAAAGFEQGGVPGRWRRFAEEEWVTRLEPLAARGLWSRQEPFGRPSRGRGRDRSPLSRGPRLVLRRAARFRAAVPPVSTDLHRTEGLRLALGIGEAPVGLQGTFSVWDSTSALNDFAYRRSAHTAVVDRTPREHWYAEEPFARFGVRSTSGTVDGVDPLGSAAPGRR
jgi:hypothetical protein